MAWVFSLFWMLYFCVSKREAPCWCQRGANVSLLPLSTSEEFWELPRLASGSHPTPIWRSRMYPWEPHSDSSSSLGSPWGRQQHDCFLWQQQMLATAGWAAFPHGRWGAVTMVSTPRTSSSQHVAAGTGGRTVATRDKYLTLLLSSPAASRWPQTNGVGLGPLNCVAHWGPKLSKMSQAHLKHLLFLRYLDSLSKPLSTNFKP